MRLELSIAAIRDLRQIFEWTERNFGLAQAAKYQRALNVSIRAVLANPSTGKRYRGARLETRRIRSGRHFVYYRFSGTILSVVRVLHERMAQDQHLV